jgi:alkylation response protein AidB-like acyl-CoA dehydrogenase
MVPGLLSGSVIGLPPVLNFGRPEIRDRVVADVMSGKKLICLAVSEAFAGSDVAGLRTTAVKTPDGKHWIINGTKKVESHSSVCVLGAKGRPLFQWITNGTFSH